MVYINGNVVRMGDFVGFSWEGVEIMLIMLGVFNFMYWNYNFDVSQLDELWIFNRVLIQEEIQ